MGGQGAFSSYSRAKYGEGSGLLFSSVKQCHNSESVMSIGMECQAGLMDLIFNMVMSGS